MIFTPPGDVFTKEHYNRVLEIRGDGFPPATMSEHIMGMTDEGEVRIVDVFESAEAFGAWAESQAPVFEEIGINLEDALKYASVFEIENTISQ